MLIATVAAFLVIAPSDPVLIASPDKVAGAAEPQVAVDDSGQIVVAFGAKDSIYVSHSTDGGATYDAPLPVASLPKMMLGRRRGPRIAAANGNVVVSAISNGNLVAWSWQSSGAMWTTAPAQVNDSDGTADEGLHAMAASSDLIVCAWLDHRDKCTDIYAAVSHDGGQNWGANSLVYKAPNGNVCECCHPSIVISQDDTIHVMFRNSDGGNRDIYVTDSSDEGQTWSTPALLGKGHWKLDVCPMDGGAIGADSDSHLTTIWRREDAIFTAAPEFPEKKIGPGLQPWIYGGQGKFAVYLKREGGPVMWFKGSNAPQVLATQGVDPVVGGPISGSGPVVAAWATPKGEIMAETLAK